MKAKLFMENMWEFSSCFFFVPFNVNIPIFMQGDLNKSNIRNNKSFKKVLILHKNFFFAKFEYRYQKNAKFYIDFETVEENEKNLLTKKL